MDAGELTKFILAAQDNETGGISDRPGNYPDPFHTLFGLAGLSLLSRLPGSSETASTTSECNGEDPVQVACATLRDINPVLCMPQHVIDRCGVKVQLLK